MRISEYVRRGCIPITLITLLCFGARCQKPEPSAPVDKIVVVKSVHTMTLYTRGRALKVYRVALGRGPGNAKQRHGDHETPEGAYVIDAKNAHSKFHLALHISYPNSADRSRAKKLGVDPGGDIMIHGLPRGLGWIGQVQHMADWTDGCIALTNGEIDEVWRVVPTGTPIEIRH